VVGRNFEDSKFTELETFGQLVLIQNNLHELGAEQ
jgi:hypothetical protein